MELWSQVKALEGQTLYTLERRKPFLVARVNPDHIIVIPDSTKKPMPPITKEILEQIYKHLVKHGSLERAEIRENFSDFNPAYISAILANLKSVTFSTKPITLVIDK